MHKRDLEVAGIIGLCCNADAELESERTTNADLMRRLTEFAQRLQTRNDSLTKVKKQSDDHISSLNEELSQVKQVPQILSCYV